MSKKLPINVGDKKHSLTVIEEFHGNRHGRDLRMLRCLCDCGKTTEIRAEAFGHTKSCGCAHKNASAKNAERAAIANRTHGQTGTRLYRIWRCMKSRCYDDKHEAYSRYGGRGITVCDAWKNSFIEFQDWAHKSGYREDLTIDRIDNDKGYCPDNCRWATINEQQNNRRDNRQIEFDGITMNATQWAAAMGFPNDNIIHDRLARGWSIEQTLTTPVDSQRRNREAKSNCFSVEVERLTGWDSVLDAARNTVNKPPLGKEPSQDFKYSVLIAEHSPIRALTFKVIFHNIEYSSSVHLCRHFTGVLHYVGTQRTDRTGVDRDCLPQTNLVTHEMIINANAIIFISRRRLCCMASTETQKVWRAFIDELRKIEPELADCCVPECMYRGGMCPEKNTCGRMSSESYKRDLGRYAKHFSKSVTEVCYGR